MNPAAGGAASIGIPPLNLSQGPSTALATSDGTQTGQNSGTATNGDFVFKGNSAGSLGATMTGLSPVLIMAALGVAGWIAIKRFA